MDTLTNILLGPVQATATWLGAMTPRLLAMVAFIVIGWALAAVMRRVTGRLLRATAFDQRCVRWGVTATLGRIGVREVPAVLLGHAVFWTILLVGLLMGVDALGVPAVTGVVATVLHYLPNLIVAGVILITGWVLANFLGQAALIGAVNAQVAGAPVIAGAVRWLVLVFAGAAVLTQLGIAREMVLLAFGIAFGGTVLALALAFGLGGKDLAREILESRLRKRNGDDHITHL
ncbi:MAG TPA: hypothetical protein VMD08_11120 [Candidatus Baltobacteraceae bacterium]|nr:hypothetical protein [Candidatus Baltobacteraceae bacterium]